MDNQTLNAVRDTIRNNLDEVMQTYLDVTVTFNPDTWEMTGQVKDKETNQAVWATAKVKGVPEYFIYKNQEVASMVHQIGKRVLKRLVKVV